MADQKVIGKCSCTGQSVAVGLAGRIRRATRSRSCAAHHYTGGREEEPEQEATDSRAEEGRIHLRRAEMLRNCLGLLDLREGGHSD